MPQTTTRPPRHLWQHCVEHRPSTLSKYTSTPPGHAAHRSQDRLRREVDRGIEAELRGGRRILSALPAAAATRQPRSFAIWPATLLPLRRCADQHGLT
jgi:hypothetical protein